MSSPLRGVTKAPRALKITSRLRKYRSYLASRRRISRHPSNTPMPSVVAERDHCLRCRPMPSGAPAGCINPVAPMHSSPRILRGLTRTRDRNGRVDDGEKMWTSVKAVGVSTRLTYSHLRLKRLFAQIALWRLGFRICLPSASATRSDLPPPFSSLSRLDVSQPPCSQNNCPFPPHALQHMRSYL